MDRFSSDAVRAIMPKITAKPVPETPNPISTAQIWCASAEMDIAESAMPAK